jgi:hypothetical protein
VREEESEPGQSLILPSCAGKRIRLEKNLSLKEGDTEVFFPAYPGTKTPLGRRERVNFRIHPLSPKALGKGVELGNPLVPFSHAVGKGLEVRAENSTKLAL